MLRARGCSILFLSTTAIRPAGGVPRLRPLPNIRRVLPLHYIPGLCAGHDPALGSHQEVIKKPSRVDSGYWVRGC